MFFLQLDIYIKDGTHDTEKESEYASMFLNHTITEMITLSMTASILDEFLAGQSQFDSDHGVDLYAPTCCQSATFGPLFAFYCPLFFTIFVKNNVAFRFVYAARAAD